MPNKKSVKDRESKRDRKERERERKGKIEEEGEILKQCFNQFAKLKEWLLKRVMKMLAVNMHCLGQR